MNGLHASVSKRRLTLLEGDCPRLALPLDAGGRHRMVVGDGDIARQVVRALEACPGVGVLPANGGLLGNLTVAANFALVLRYDDEREGRSERDRDLAAAFELCGLTPERVAALAREQPMNLERSERWKVGFVRCLLRPPELLVIDRLFAGLTRRQADGLIAVEAIYHARHPFRPVLFVDLDSHELPALPDCRTLTEIAELSELAEAACPC
jgi:ABC-type branched-subunit amino acid transport system ATPase component